MGLYRALTPASVHDLVSHQRFGGHVVGVRRLLKEAGFIERRPPSSPYSRFQLPGERLSLYVNDNSDDRYVSINRKALDGGRYAGLRASVRPYFRQVSHLKSDYDVACEHVPKLIEAIKAMRG